METEAAWAELLSIGELGDDVVGEYDGDLDDDRATELVALIQERGEEIVLDWALPMLTDPYPGQRQAAAWVLGQHGYLQGRPFGDRVLPALVDAARNELDAETREYLVGAIAMSEDPSAAEELMFHADDEFPGVREAVASRLPSVFGFADHSQRAIDTIISLTVDPDADVRNWATFSLGTSFNSDGRIVREALWARTSDSFDEVRKEAAMGLARRRDPRAPSLVADLLARQDGHFFLLDAAAFLADASLLAGLGKYEEGIEGLDDALRECDPARRLQRDDFAEQVLETLTVGMPDYHVRLFGERFEIGLTIGAVGNDPEDDFSWDVAGLTERSGGDAARAAALMLQDVRCPDSDPDGG